MIPLALTTITVSRVASDGTLDGYDPQPDPTTITTGLRAVIGNPGGSQNITAGDRTVVTFPFTTDPADIQADDTITDETTGTQYRVEWCRPRTGLGLDHVEGECEQVSGASDRPRVHGREPTRRRHRAKRTFQAARSSSR